MTPVLFALRRYAKLQLEPGKAGAATNPNPNPNPNPYPNQVAFICLAMAIGMSVDYVVHLSHAFEHQA